MNEIQKAQAPLSLAPSIAFDRNQVETIRQDIAPTANDEQFGLFIAKAQMLGLNPIQGHCYIVPRTVKIGNEYKTKQVFQLSLNGALALANRSGRVQGFGNLQWADKDARWHDVWIKEGYPYAARCIIHVRGKKPVEGIVTWREYAQKTSNGAITKMWDEKPSFMLMKCAKMQAIREAFPNEMGGIQFEMPLEGIQPIDVEVLPEEKPEFGKTFYCDRIKQIAVQHGWSEMDLADYLHADWGTALVDRLDNEQLVQCYEEMRLWPVPERSDLKSDRKQVASIEEPGKPTIQERAERVEQAFAEDEKEEIRLELKRLGLSIPNAIAHIARNFEVDVPTNPKNFRTVLSLLDANQTNELLVELRKMTPGPGRPQPPQGGTGRKTFAG